MSMRIKLLRFLRRSKLERRAHGSGRKSHQKTFFDFLLTLTPANWVNTIHHKLQVFTSPQISVPVSQESGVSNEEQFCTLCKTCKSLGVRTTMAAIKTWSNAWTTTTRMHEAIELPCIFGCPAFLTWGSRWLHRLSRNTPGRTQDFFQIRILPNLQWLLHFPCQILIWQPEGFHG